ncbi:MAG: lipopolysaccharide heptosyltransferase II, partial [Deltaproteobacteria bacterium]|nr:lipopolysaccharide heptosyltransferase II [Deltaproteobacteria bacterium]
MRTKNVRRIHQTRYYLEMLNGLGLNPYEEPPAIEISERDSSTADEFLRRRGFDSPRVFAGIAPGAAFGPAKMWFPDRFAAVAQGLIDRLGVSILLFGSASDRPAAETIGKALSGTVVNLAGETTLDEAIALMARCSLFVSNDSGLMHLVAALGIPVVALFGSTDPAVTAPQGKRLRVIYKNPSCGPCLKKQCPGDFRCMKSISTEEVLAEAIDLFESADTND